METCSVYRSVGSVPGLMAVAYQRVSEGEGWHAFLKTPFSQQVSYRTFHNETAEAAIDSMEKFTERRFWCQIGLHPDL